jgi:hypothetical protein
MIFKLIALAASMIVLAVTFEASSYAAPKIVVETDSCCCPIPLYDTGSSGLGRRIPFFADVNDFRSPDGKHLAFLSGESDSAFTLDLATLERKPIVIQTGLPKIVIGFLSTAWCPYDPDLLAVCLDVTDSIYPGLNRYGNIYTYRLSTGECTRITPKVFGPIGDTVGLLRLLSWRHGSSTASDTLEITSQHIDDDSEEFYIPQTQAVFRTPWNGRLQTVAQTHSESHVIMAQREPRDDNYQLDGNSLPLIMPIQRLECASFSPNEKLLALSVRQNGQGPPADTSFPQVWVYRMDSLSAPPLVINFQKWFCMYNFWGMNAEFITGSTLAVTMHKDGDESSPLWEITLDGRIVRQLTFLPEFPSDVQSEINSAVLLRVYPNPAGNELQIFGGQPGTVRLFDMLGRQVLTQVSNSSEATLDIARLPQGTYFLRSGSASAKVIIAR